ncbi:MAG: hypothetical protein ABH954_00405 [Candidatus Omnitrophota bacterium]
MKKFLAAIMVLTFFISLFGCSAKLKAGDKRGRTGATVSFPVGR